MASCGVTTSCSRWRLRRPLPCRSTCCVSTAAVPGRRGRARGLYNGAGGPGRDHQAASYGPCARHLRRSSMDGFGRLSASGGASRLSQVSSRQMAQLCDHGWASSTSTTPSGVLHCRGARRSRFRAGGRWWRGSEHAGFFARAAGHLGTLHRQPGRRCHRSAECASDSRGLRAICRAQQSENSFSSCDQRGPFGGRLGKTQRTSRAGSCSRLGRAETVQQPSREPAADALAQVAAGVAQRQLRRWDPAAYRKRGSLAATARAIRANACAELGVPLSAAIPGLLREFLDKRVGLADHRTLAYFATFLAYGWQLAREADNIELEAYAGRGIMMVEQMVDGVGRWPAPSGLVTGWPSGSQARKHNSLRPFSKLAKPAWCAANLTFLRDLDNLEARLKAAREQKPSGSDGPQGDQKDETAERAQEEAGAGRGRMISKCSSGAQERLPTSGRSETGCSQFCHAKGCDARQGAPWRGAPSNFSIEHHQVGARPCRRAGIPQSRPKPSRFRLPTLPLQWAFFHFGFFA